uniref:Putative GH46: distantly related to chitosanases n=1 Tax=Magnetococcus massalia (strain MO-1) TaxID=451514 RepID=A0A1S7LHU3_MAGMO|nr:putative GH46 : distantly related to chitosanases [Candidatus Magnetococcus massalia]
MTSLKPLIQQIVNIFETGKPAGDYAMLATHADGRGGSRQITYGRSQTTEQGNLVTLIEMYVEAGGRYADDFIPYLSLIGEKPLVDNSHFKQLLVMAAELDPLMCQTQDQFFDQAYWNPAMAWCAQRGFKHPLSWLVIYDSFIHSGRVAMYLRKRFRAQPPSAGGQEEAWLSAYVNTRHDWLANHPFALLRNTTYRTETFKRLINKDNWDLSQRPIQAHGVLLDESLGVEKG